MPKEVRHILFSPEEVFAALADGLASADAGWSHAPEHLRLDLATDASGAVLARLVLRRPLPGRRSVWRIGSGDLLAMLLACCKRSRIPLPLRGEKRLELVGVGLCLTVTLGGETGEPDVLRGAVRYPDPQLASLLGRRSGL